MGYLVALTLILNGRPAHGEVPRSVGCVAGVEHDDRRLYEGTPSKLIAFRLNPSRSGKPQSYDSPRALMGSQWRCSELWR